MKNIDYIYSYFRRHYIYFYILFKKARKKNKIKKASYFTSNLLNINLYSHEKPCRIYINSLEEIKHHAN